MGTGREREGRGVAGITGMAVTTCYGRTERLMRGLR